MEEMNDFRVETVSDGAEKNDREWVTKLRYLRSFTAKIILSEERIKEYFAGLSNAILAYEKTRSSRSRSGDGFYRGRKQVARLAFSGKTLCLYLSVDPALYQKGKYKCVDVGKKKKYAAVPAKLKIKSNGAYRYALALLAKVEEERGTAIRKDPVELVSASQYPFEPFESLLARDLIRIILPKASKPSVPEEPVAPQGEQISSAKNAEWVEKLRYSRSFLAKLILSDVRIKEYYAAIATKLLSFDKVKSRLSWGGISFTCGRTPISKINFSGKTLCVYLAVDPAQYQKGRYKFKDAGNVKKYAQVPAKFKVKSDKALEFLIGVIDTMAKDKAFSPRVPAMLPISAKNFPTDTFDNLIARGLIRIINTQKKELRRNIGVGDGVPVASGESVSLAGESVPTVGEGVSVAGERVPVADETAPVAGEGVGEGTAEGVLGEGEKVPVADENAAAVGERIAEGTAEGVLSEGTVGEAAGEGIGEGATIKEGAVLSDEGKENVVVPDEGEKGAAVPGSTGERLVYISAGTDANGEDIMRAMSEASYKDTILTNKALVERHEEYDIILGFLKRKTADVKLVKRYIVKTIDEKWITAIEDCLDALDDCVRKPTHFIEETEELLPIERTKKVTPRSIRHLCEHTDLIAKATDDEIIPTHLLNIFRDDSMMTYENKFLNTLLRRLYLFVNDRYNQALRNGANERVSVLSVSDNFTDGPIRGRFSFTLELSEPHGENVRNAVQTKDLWKRVVKLRGIVGDYFKSELALNLGNTFILPPVIRTNAILKNPNMRQCLKLWEFIESYEDEGNGITMEEKEETLTNEHVDMLYQGIAEQYLVLRFNTAEDAAFLGGPQWDVGLPEQTQDKTVYGTKNFVPPETESNEEIIWAVEAAIAADLYLDRLTEEERIKREKEREELLKSELLEKQEQEKKEREKREEVAYAEAAVTEEEPAQEQTSESEEEEAEEERDEESESEEETQEEVAMKEGESFLPVVRYKKSFEAKLRLSAEETKEYYCEIYNKFMSKSAVRARESYSSVTFTVGRKTLAKVTVVGRTLRAYFALDPASLPEKFTVRDCSEIKKFAQTPAMIKIRSGRSYRVALTLVDMVCEGLEDSNKEFIHATASDYGTETVEKLVEMGLAQKYVAEAPSFQPAEEKKPKPDLSGAGGDALVPQKEAMSDKEVKLTLEKPKKEETEIRPIEPRREVAEGDALSIKPTTLEEMLAYESGKKMPTFGGPSTEKQEQKPTTEQKESFWSRLFKRKK